jgi:hypothetical protein
MTVRLKQSYYLYLLIALLMQLLVYPSMETLAPGSFFINETRSN